MKRDNFYKVEWSQADEMCPGERHEHPAALHKSFTPASLSDSFFFSLSLSRNFFLSLSLLGTEEGSLHRCSVSYNEQVHNISFHLIVPFVHCLPLSSIFIRRSVSVSYCLRCRVYVFVCICITESSEAYLKNY